MSRRAIKTIGGGGGGGRGEACPPKPMRGAAVIKILVHVITFYDLINSTCWPYFKGTEQI